MYPTRKRDLLRRDLFASVADGAAFSVMVGMGETYLPAFVLAVGLGEVTAGLVVTVPLVTGAALQMASPWLVSRLQSYKRWCVLTAFVQAGVFIPLVLGAVRGSISTASVLLAATVYWACSLGANPAWNAWMSQTVPPAVRPRYFASRTRVAQGAVMSGLLVGGATLQYAKADGRALTGFVLVFVAASLCRLVSGGFLMLQRDRPLTRGPRRMLTPIGLFQHLPSTQRRLLVYMLSIQFTAQLAAPYFTPFMLRELRFSYASYMLLLAVAFLARIMILPALGRVAHRHGAKPILWIGGIGIIPLSAAWLISHSVPFLLVVQMCSGFAWAAYELATFLLLFETIPDEHKTEVLTAFNLTNAIAQVMGSVAGGMFLHWGGDEAWAYLALFGISSVARIATVPLLRLVVEPVSAPEPVSLRTLAVRPADGSLDRPIVATRLEKKV